ncbi:MAG: PINc/VapC family ATPase [Halobacteriaceae archaeon]
MKLVPDTSVIIDGRISERVRSDEFKDATIIIPEAVVSELEFQANNGQQSGWDGLAELQELITLSEEDIIEIDYRGNRPSIEEYQQADKGTIDASIRQIAREYDATFVTSDIVQSEVAKAKDIDVIYIEPKTRSTERLAIQQYFDDQTMSVHLKEGVPPMAKRGEVGNIQYEEIDDEVLDESTLREYAEEVLTIARGEGEGVVELSEPGMDIVQYQDYRIAISQPPFSDGIEITAVRPIVKTSLEDYKHDQELKDRLLERDRGVLIAGSPGAGKSTFAQAVAEFLADNDYVVKTMEKPRDLQVADDITQYTELGGSMETTADSLLMVRPDYTIYDEVRKTDDFEVFADMRLAGVGMVGVVHATRAIDALQRLVGRVELGMIPQVVDTIIFIEAGNVAKVYDVVTEVKVPEGLMEEDLARPVIQVRDFETETPEYEIYTFNRQVVTVPLDETNGGTEAGVDKLAKQEIEREIQSLTKGEVSVDITNPNRAKVFVDEDDISYIIGKGGGRISDIEDRLGIELDVRPLSEREGRTKKHDSTEHAGQQVAPDITGRHIILPLDENKAGETVEIRANGEYLFTATVGRNGDIKVSRGSAIAEELEDAIDKELPITVVPS